MIHHSMTFGGQSPSAVQAFRTTTERRMTAADLTDGVTARADEGQMTVVVADLLRAKVYTATSPSDAPNVDASLHVWMKSLRLGPASVALAFDGGEATAIGARSLAKAYGSSTATARWCSTAVASSPAGTGTISASAAASLGATASAYSTHQTARAEATASGANRLSFARAREDGSSASAVSVDSGAWAGSGLAGLACATLIRPLGLIRPLDARAVAVDGARVSVTSENASIEGHGTGQGTSILAVNRTGRAVEGRFSNGKVNLLNAHSPADAPAPAWTNSH